MAKTFHCPRCGVDISDSFEHDDPEVGIRGGYYCEVCEEGYPDEPEDDLLD